MKGSPPVCSSDSRPKRSHVVDKARGETQDGGHWEDVVGIFPRVAVPCHPEGCRDLRYDMRGAPLWRLSGE